MRRVEFLRVALAAYAAWLERQLPPAGKAALHGLTARAEALIDAIPAGGGPGPPPLETLDAGPIQAGLDWLLTAMRVAYPDGWAPLAAEALRLLLHRNIDAVAALAQPPAAPPEEASQ